MALSNTSVKSVDLTHLRITPELLNIIPADLMAQLGVIPFDRHGNVLRVAMRDPYHKSTLDRVRVLASCEIEPYIASADIIAKTIERYQLGSKEKAVKTSDVSPAATSAVKGLDESPMAALAGEIFESALKQRASDIHFEPQAKGLFIRFRIDGVLKTVRSFPRETGIPLVSSIKVAAGMDIAERRLPQDGQISLTVSGKAIDLRVSSLPSKNGEKIVIRVLDKSVGARDLGVLGLDPATQSLFERMVDKPQGIILVTGPTGSGKSTTLYSVLNRLKSPMRNIITLEDPIEYELAPDEKDGAGVTQVQINSRVGLTFAAGLRASLRQDPDIIMVGEIRDQETAEVSMKAAMTGHFVLSTLHTNDAIEAVTRLRDIGVEPYLIASALIGVMAQRLLRKLCEECKVSYVPPPRVLQSLFGHLASEAPPKLYRSKGCPKCHETGYWGRIGIYELLSIDDALKSLIHAGTPTDELRHVAEKNGLHTLRQSGLEAVAHGLTTVEEVIRSTI